MSSSSAFISHSRPHEFNLIAGTIAANGEITGVASLAAPGDLTVSGTANVAELPAAPRAGQIRLGVNMVDHTSPTEVAGELILWGFQPMKFRRDGLVTAVTIGGNVAGQWTPMAAIRNYDGDIANIRFPVVDYVNLFAEVTHLSLEFTGTLPDNVYAWWAFSEGLL